MDELNNPARRLKDADMINTAKKADEMAHPAQADSSTIDAAAPCSAQALERPLLDYFEHPITGSKFIYPVGPDGLPLNTNNAISLPVGSEASSSVEEVKRNQEEALATIGIIGGERAMGFTCSSAAAAKAIADFSERNLSVLQQRSSPCGNCGSVRHLLAECLLAGRHGVVEGCAFHNNKDHNTDQCPEFINAGLSFKVRLLVTSRGRLPPLAAGDAWYPLAAKWNAQNPDDLIQMYPWTTELTRSLSFACPALQEVFDDHRDYGKLPIDPATKDWPAVQSSFATSTTI